MRLTTEGDPPVIIDAQFRVVDQPMVTGRGPILPHGVAGLISAIIVASSIYGACIAQGPMERVMAVLGALYGVYFSRFVAWLTAPVPVRDMVDFWARYRSR